MEKNTAVVFEDIKETGGRYRWMSHLNVHVIEDTSNSYINATKMCAMYGQTKKGQPKHFTDWKYTNKQFIVSIESMLHLSKEQSMYSIINGRDSIKGTYIHRDLAMHLAMWCSVEFGFKVYKMIHACIERENTLLLERNRILTERIDAIEEQRVVPTQDPRFNELLVLMYSPHEDYYVVLRTQECGLKQAVRRCKLRHGTLFEPVLSIMSYQNSRNMFHRFRDFVRESTELKAAVTFRGTSFETTLDLETIKNVFVNLERR